MHRIVALALTPLVATADLPNSIKCPTDSKVVSTPTVPGRSTVWKKDNTFWQNYPGLGTTAAHHCGHANFHLRWTARPRSAGVLEAR